jgi:hypothetical protein
MQHYGPEKIYAFDTLCLKLNSVTNYSTKLPETARLVICSVTREANNPSIVCATVYVKNITSASQPIDSSLYRCSFDLEMFYSTKKT